MDPDSPYEGPTYNTHPPLTITTTTNSSSLASMASGTAPDISGTSGTHRGAVDGAHVVHAWITVSVCDSNDRLLIALGPADMAATVQQLFILVG